jgi:hypothetical protein
LTCVNAAGPQRLILGYLVSAAPGIKMIARVLILLVLLVGSAAHAAQANEPTVYVFWSAEGTRSQQAVQFLRAAEIADPKLSVRYFELDKNPDNAKLLEAVYQRIGVSNIYTIPSIFVGHNVFMGFDDTQHTGPEILKDVAQCRVQGCIDLVRDLLTPEDSPQAVHDRSLRGVVVLKPTIGSENGARCQQLPADRCRER